jgi:hypothetical protein
MVCWFDDPNPDLKKETKNNKTWITQMISWLCTSMITMTFHHACEMFMVIKQAMNYHHPASN